MIDFFRKNRVLAIVASLSVFFLLLSLILAVFNFTDFSPPLIIHFDQYRGADLLGGLAGFWLIIGGVFAMIASNVFLIRILWEREKFMAYFLFLADFVLSVLLLLVVIVIVGVN